MSFEEDQLPVELDKLEISSTIPQIKFNDSQISMALNPFFNNKINNKTEHNSELFQNAKSRTTHRRRFRFRRRSESYLDECKESPSCNLEHIDVSIHQNTRCQHMPRVQKQSLKKSTAGTTKRSVLREPVLRCLNTSIHSKCSARRSLQNNSSEEEKTSNSHATTKSQGICNFRELLKECHNLIEHDSDFKGRFPSIKINCPVSKSFTTLQSKESNNACNSATPLVNNIVTGNVDSTISTTNSIKTANEPAGISSIIRSSTSCSQQASNNNGTNNCGDVTINELASYFETMVHIPKKMSSMAEMMYI